MGYIIMLLMGVMIGSLNTWKNADTEYLQEVTNKCENNKGIERVAFRPFASTNVYCNDGATFHVKESE